MTAKVRFWLLVASYVLLVALVVVGAGWVQHEFEQSHDERCALAQAQSDVALAQIRALAFIVQVEQEAHPGSASVPTAAEQAELEARIRRSASTVDATCG